mgnify:CR=1 FL=1
MCSHLRVRVFFRPRSGFSGRGRSPSGTSRYPWPWATPRGEARWALCSRRRRWGVGARFFLRPQSGPRPLGGGEGPTGLPSRSRAQHLVALSGVGLHWGKGLTTEHGDTMDSPQMETGTREKGWRVLFARPYA